MKRFILCIGMLAAISNLDAKVLIMTHSYNRPDFIEIQYKTFKKFLKDEYEFVVFNDARNATIVAAIENMCEKLGLRCIRIPQDIHSRPYLKRWPGENYQDGAVRNCNVVMYSLNELGFSHDGIVAIFDSDMFLVKNFSIEEYMKDYDIAGGMSGGKYSYIWIGLAFMDMRTMPDKTTINFNCGRIHDHPVDAGGHTYYYLRDNPTIRLREMNGFNTGIVNLNDTTEIERWFLDEKTRNFMKKQPNNMDFMVDQKFLHYRSGTNWDNKSANYHQHKTELFNEYINTLLND